jgi:hypothetical protein
MTNNVIYEKNVIYARRLMAAPLASDLSSYSAVGPRGNATGLSGKAGLRSDCPSSRAECGVARAEHVHEIVSGSPFGRGKDRKYP